MSPQTPTLTTWHGWYRRSKRERWTRLVEDAGYDAAWGKLLDATARMPSGGELLVTRNDPNERSRR